MKTTKIVLFVSAFLASIVEWLVFLIMSDPLLIDRNPLCDRRESKTN